MLKKEIWSIVPLPYWVISLYFCFRLVMNGKLFVVMGVTWALEIVSSQVKDPPWIWYLSDAANALQGALIFCIFVMKRKVLHTLALRFGLRIRAYKRPNTAENLTCYDPYRVRKTSSNLTLNTTLTDSRCTRFSTNSNRWLNTQLCYLQLF